jgi:hypothetical protein
VLDGNVKTVKCVKYVVCLTQLKDVPWPVNNVIKYIMQTAFVR